MKRRSLLKLVGGGIASAGLMGSAAGSVSGDDRHYTDCATVEIEVTSSGATEEVPAEWYDKVQRSDEITSDLVRDYLGKEWVERILETSGDDLICDTHAHPEIHVYVTDVARAQSEFPNEVDYIPIVIREADNRTMNPLAGGAFDDEVSGGVIPLGIASTGIAGMVYGLWDWSRGKTDDA